MTIAISCALGVVALSSELVALVPAFKACWTPVSIGALKSAYEGHPYSVTFEIRNLGLFAVRDVGWSCEIPNVTFGSGQFRNVSVSSGGGFSSAIEPQQSRTGHCEGLVVVPDSFNDWPRARYAIVVSFRSFFARRRSARFNFEAIVDPVTSRLVRWVPE